MNWVCGIATVFHTALHLWSLLDLCLGNLLNPAQHEHRSPSESNWIGGLPLRRHCFAGLVSEHDELQLLSFQALSGSSLFVAQ